MRINTEKLRIEIYRKGYSQVWLARETGISRATLSSIMNGKSCREDTARKIADALQVKMEDLY